MEILSPIQWLSMIGLAVIIAVAVRIMTTKPHRRLVTAPILWWSIIGFLFYTSLLSGILVSGTHQTRFVSSVLRLHDVIVVLGIAILILWKPNRGTGNH